MSGAAPRVTLLCGPAGAGKTTWAHGLVEAGAVRLSMDQAQWADGWRQTEAPPARLAELHAGLQQQLREAVGLGRDVVVDLSLSTRAIRDDWRALATAAGAEVDLVVLTAPWPVLAARVRARDGVHDADAVRVPPDRLRAYVDGFEWPGGDENPRVVDTG